MQALNHLDKGRVVIFACGTGNPYFSTDTAAALRSAEIGAQVLLSAKNIDGIYTGDPKTDTKAVKIDRISYMEFINRELKAMDATAVQICMENKIPVIAFGLKEKGAMLKIIKGEKIGTIID